MRNLETVETLKNGNTKSSKSPKKEKQPNQLIYHFFTLNNWTTEERDEILNFCKSNIVAKYMFQEETGKEGTPHLQGNIELKKKGRWTSFNLCKRIHWEKTRNVEKAFEYCSKEDTRTGKTYTNIKPLKYIPVENFYDWQKNLFDILQGEPDERKIYWIYEEKGNRGKSAFVKTMCYKYDAIMCNGGKCKDLINLVYNADMEKCNTILWDLPRSNKGRVSYDAIECIKNGMICNTKYETGTKIFNAPHIMIFSNYEPVDKENLSEDRWNIINI